MTLPTARQTLAGLLSVIAQSDPSYTGSRAAVHDEFRYARRNRCIWHALAIAVGLGYGAGVRIDPAEPDWPVVYIELPEVGQVSWHVPAYTGQWDGHTVAEKYDRIAEFNRRTR